MLLRPLSWRDACASRRWQPAGLSSAGAMGPPSCLAAGVSSTSNPCASLLRPSPLLSFSFSLSLLPTIPVSVHARLRLGAPQQEQRQAAEGDSAGDRGDHPPDHRLGVFPAPALGAVRVRPARVHRPRRCGAPRVGRLGSALHQGRRGHAAALLHHARAQGLGRRVVSPRGRRRHLRGTHACLCGKGWPVGPLAAAARLRCRARGVRSSFFPPPPSSSCFVCAFVVLNSPVSPETGPACAPVHHATLSNSAHAPRGLAALQARRIAPGSPAGAEAVGTDSARKRKPAHARSRGSGAQCTSPAPGPQGALLRAAVRQSPQHRRARPGSGSGALSLPRWRVPQGWASWPRRCGASAPRCPPWTQSERAGFRRRWC